MFEEGLNLLPCPHCGKPATLWAVDMSEGVYVFCDNCGMRGPLTEEMTEHAAITAWNALPRRLPWTKEKPTEPGWYWHDKNMPSIVRVVKPSSGRMFYCVLGYHGQCDVLDDDGEWAGPIPEPKE